ncbi:MAG: NADH-quinone oxidoreductase subunit NuoE [Candidatus Bipolaricaulota bacterium]|nr:NADH-quinone oxidoreductase subunit NuoE [Candidatus Bipolaricaulota bacterium]
MKELLQKYPPSAESLLDILHGLQDAEPHHCLSDDALRAVAEYVSVPLSEVVSTATFYSMYSRRPRGRHIVRICESPPCHLAGTENLLDTLTNHLGIEIGGTTSDGTFTLETTSCLGLCAEAPAMMIDDRMYGHLTREKALSAIAEARRSDAAK